MNGTLRFAVALSVLLAIPVVGQARYRLTDLGTSPQGLGTSHTPCSINNRGQIAGGDSGIWEASTGWTPIGICAVGINNLGQVAGREGENAAYWDPTDGVHILTVPDPLRPLQGSAVDINDAGVVVGTNGSEAWWWYRGEFRFMSKPNLLRSLVMDINNRPADEAVSVGSVEQKSGASWRRADGPTYYYSGDSQDAVILSSINDSGVIVGWTNQTIAGSVVQHARIWSSHYDSLSLCDGTALAINNRNQVVGSTGERAFIWESATGSVELQGLVAEPCGLTLAFAVGINDNGWIIGSATDSAGIWHGFVLQPVPEPATLPILLSGLAGLAGPVRRRLKADCR